MRVRYTYRNFPFSPKATEMGRKTAILTSWPFCCVFGFFWLAIVNSLLMGIGLSGDLPIILAFVSLIGFYFVVKKIKKTLNQKIEAVALADLKRLQETNPEEFLKYVNASNG